MTRLPDIHCPPYAQPSTPEPTDSILELASRASAASNAYRSAMDNRAGFRETMSAAGTLARATDELTTAIADAVACGDGSLTWTPPDEVFTCPHCYREESTCSADPCNGAKRDRNSLS